MSNVNKPQPELNELPSSFSDRMGIYYASTGSQENKKVKGQFFTPVAIAKLMASLSDYRQKKVRVLDPGCGAAVLSCCLIENLIVCCRDLKEIELVAYETDVDLISCSEAVLAYLKQWLAEKNIRFTYLLHIEDFVLDNAQVLNTSDNLFATIIEPFDIIISNPPYFKLSKDDTRTKAAQVVVSGQPNIYSIFMAVAARLLKPQGELIFITPRSFSSGNYFKAFREYFFRIIQLEKIHLFVSRKDTFTRDSVLQELVIIKGIYTGELNDTKQVSVASSRGLKDIDTPSIKYFASKELIDFDTNEKILHLPINDVEEVILNMVKSWKGTLKDFKIQISTGPVVAFRSWDYIQEHYENGTVFLGPLFWLHNVNKMSLEYPVVKPNKGQYIRIEQGSMPLLLPNKNYIFLRRFSTKDDKSRLIAAPYFCNYIKADYIGVENKVNYIYRPKGHLDRNEVVGLCALLNSELFDNYFRIFNGNVNVSATELREMTFPPLEIIKEIGDKIILSNDYSLENVNSFMSKYFELLNPIIVNE